MASFKEQYGDWKLFWGEVLVMWRKEHGLTLANCLRASFPLAILSLVVLIVSAISQNDSWKIGSGIALGISGFIAFFNFCFIFPFKKYIQDTSKLKARISELVPLEEYKESQKGNEQDWLHLIIEYIGIDKRPNYSENEITVKFDFDSGLVYPFKPLRMWVSPTFGGHCPSEAQYEFEQTPNFIPGKRSQISSFTIGIKDGKLQELLKGIRGGLKMKKGLEIKMQFTNGNIHRFSEDLD